MFVFSSGAESTLEHVYEEMNQKLFSNYATKAFLRLTRAPHCSKQDYRAALIPQTFLDSRTGGDLVFWLVGGAASAGAAQAEKLVREAYRDRQDCLCVVSEPEGLAAIKKTIFGMALR